MIVPVNQDHDVNDVMKDMYRKFYADYEAYEKRNGDIRKSFNAMREILQKHIPKYAEGGYDDLTHRDNGYICKAWDRTIHLAEDTVKRH